MPARSEFFKRAVFGRKLAGFGCFRREWPIMRAATSERNLRLVAPHDLSSKFLLRMRGQDHPPALAFLDQPAILRQMRGGVHTTATTARSVGGDHRAGTRHTDRPGNQTTTAATHHRASREHTNRTRRLKLDHVRASHGRRHLHLRRTNQERHTLLAPGPWTSTLLATQRPTCDAARR
jgi:hypothetical protein